MAAGGQACGSGTEGSGTVLSMKLALRAALLSPSPRLCVSSSPSDFFGSNSRDRLRRGGQCSPCCVHGSTSAEGRPATDPARGWPGDHDPMASTNRAWPSPDPPPLSDTKCEIHNHHPATSREQAVEEKPLNPTAHVWVRRGCGGSRSGLEPWNQRACSVHTGFQVPLTPRD